MNKLTNYGTKRSVDVDTVMEELVKHKLILIEEIDYEQRVKYLFEAAQSFVNNKANSENFHDGRDEDAVLDEETKQFVNKLEEAFNTHVKDVGSGTFAFNRKIYWNFVGFFMEWMNLLQAARVHKSNIPAVAQFEQMNIKYS